LKHSAPGPEKLTLRADGDAANTVRAYQNAVRSLAGGLVSTT
jgi:hypothetical protein